MTGGKGTKVEKSAKLTNPTKLTKSAKLTKSEKLTNPTKSAKLTKEYLSIALLLSNHIQNNPSQIPDELMINRYTIALDKLSEKKEHFNRLKGSLSSLRDLYDKLPQNMDKLKEFMRRLSDHIDVGIAYMFLV
jgi:hypothetical protein